MVLVQMERGVEKVSAGLRLMLGKQVDEHFKLVQARCLFSNELLLFANLGHPVDGNSCAGIDQGRYYQLLAKRAS